MYSPYAGSAYAGGLEGHPVPGAAPALKPYPWYTDQYSFRNPPSHPSHPSGALDPIAQRLISTQAVRDSQDSHAAQGHTLPDRSRLEPLTPAKSVALTAHARVHSAVIRSQLTKLYGRMQNVVYLCVSARRQALFNEVAPWQLKR
jgi:hypothetical protein